MSTDIPVAKLGGIFKRMETDEEYAARLFKARKAALPGTRGKELDDHGDLNGMQRRIVESST